MAPRKKWSPLCSVESSHESHKKSWLPHCDCQPHDIKSFSASTQALPERITPELLFLIAARARLP